MNRICTLTLAAVAALIFAVPSAAMAQAAQNTATTPTPPKSRIASDEWCQDATTVCWDDTAERKAFSGLRFVFEPQLGVLIQGGDNKFDNTNFRSLKKVGLATNVVGRWIGAQVLFIYPSSIQFDEQSPVRVEQQLADVSEGKVDVNWGGTIGLTALDGVLSLGWGMLRYDQRDFVAAVREDKSVTRDSFFYFNIQAVEAIKGAIKTIRR